ncbi:ATP-binding protein [Anaerolineales bacterium HSG25]|nr:ATP-binding protein [Anaerolineales bacterium HSG25]
MRTQHDPEKIKKYVAKMYKCTIVQDLAEIHYGLPSDKPNSLAGVLRQRFKRISLDIQTALQKSTVYEEHDELEPVRERLQVLKQELGLRRDGNNDIFYPVAEKWYQIVENYLLELEYIAGPDALIDNPYVFGMPLGQQQEIFVGRNNTSSRIRRILIDRIQLPALLYGQRRMGKTSLLKNLGRLLPDSVIFFFVDGQGIAVARDYKGLLYNVAREMMKSAKRNNLKLPRLTRENLSDDPFSVFNEWLDFVEDNLAESGFDKAILVLDEFEALDHVLDKGRFDEEDMFYMLRYLIQNRDQFEVLLAGSHTFDELPRWATHMVNVKTIKISYLKEHAVRQLIEHPIKNFTLTHEPDAIERIVSLTRGHPHLLQLLCYELVTLKNEQPPEFRYTATVADIEEVVPSALSKGSFFFIDIQENQINPASLTVLRYIATQGEDAITSPEMLMGEFSNLEENALSHIIQLLLQRDLIEKIDNGYRFQVELIRRWFVQ